jgi:ribosomal-protein-alanine N-acetyltransferase
MLTPLTSALVAAAVDLDQRCLGGMWTASGYLREVNSPNGILLALQRGSNRSPLAAEVGQSHECGVDLGAQSVDGQSVDGQSVDGQSGRSVSLQSSQSLPETSPDSPLLALGCLWTVLEEAHITILMVDPDYRRQGLGQALLWALLWASWRRSMAWITLEVRPSNAGAIALYTQFGFESIGRRRRYYHDPEEDALILWRRGLQTPEFEHSLAQWQQQVGDRLARAGWQLHQSAELEKELEQPS